MLQTTTAENGQNKKWTYQEISEMSEETRCEILEGELFMTPAPTWRHQSISENLGYAFSQHVKEKKLGKIFYAPLDVVLSETNVVQPDILFISRKNISILQKKGIVAGPPDLVVEIISPSSFHHDLHSKKELYEKFKIPEYWIVDPANETIEVFVMENGKYSLLSFASEKGKVKSAILEKLEIDLAEVFRNPGQDETT